MRHLGLAFVVLAACGGGTSSGDEWDSTVSEFVDAICVNDCVPADMQDECITDVQVDMDDARIEVGPAGEAACIECMRVKTQLLPEIEAQACSSTPDQDQEVADACDIDPTNDDDGDGDPTNDTEEACAGFP